MKAGFAHYLDLWARQMMPAVTTMFLVLLSVVPIGLPAISNVTPVFTMMAVFYWAVYRPDLVPPVVIFAIGLIQDILLGGPTGMMALALLAIYGVTLTQRQAFIGKPFFVAWIGFVVISGGAFVLMWALTCLFAARLVLAPAVLFQFVLTVFSFPLAAWAFVRVHRYLVR